MARMQVPHATEQVAPPKRGVFRRLFRRSPKTNDKKAEDKRDRTPSPQASTDGDVREEMPEMHPEATPPPSSVSRKTELVEPPEKPSKKKQDSSSTPRSAVEAAFSGPPKYRWVDIETSAAIKVQAAYRRNKVMNEMERDGHPTSAIRNRARRREYEKQRKVRPLSSLFTCCGAEFVLPDFSEQDDYEVQKEYEKLAYEERKKAQLEHEEKLRNHLGKSLKQKQGKVDEAFEVVE